jgi:uncharacterized protein YndB with AHSA1/START domain
MNKKEITIVRTMSAPRQCVWQAWTDPKQLALWWGPNGVTIPEAAIDLTVGGELSIIMLAGKALGPMEGQRWPMTGVFTEIVDAEKLVFSNNALDQAGNVVLRGETTVVFEDEGENTKLTVVTRAEGDAPGTEFMLAGMEPGWNQQLDKLVQHLG